MAAVARSSSLLVMITLLAAAGCGGRRVASVPDLQPAAVDAPIALADPRVAADSAAVDDGVLMDSVSADSVVADSAADEEALTALQELAFGSLDPGAPNVKGAIPAPTTEASGADVAREATKLFPESRGGAAAAAAPTYDIDVTTFASHKTVQLYMGFFQRLARDRFEIWLGRMARYEGMIRNRFAAQGIPEDMVYLGLIESGYSNTAVSRAKAVGMWQFMQGTGRRYGLLVDQWVDERRDPFKATDAAARLLHDLNNEFGSWYLAAAAYNGGSGRVSRGLRRLQASDTASDGTFFRLSDKRYLKRETRDYVPKLIAAALIAKEPARYGFEDIKFHEPLRFDEITVSEQTGLDVLARLADTTTATLLELNPQYFRGVTPPTRDVIVRVPEGTGPVVSERWAALPASERVTIIDHVVVRGETISGIAKRYRVEPALILAANPRVRPQALRIGQRLVIPVSVTARATYAARPRSTRARPAAQAAPAPVLATGEQRHHVVRQGESLWVIGQRYGISVGDLRRWNGLAEDQVLRAGGRLVVSPPADLAP